mmetsp:Transcript_16513/g.36489  ORF Transcript_16513/g.36489 Transcript_16513/m.36489 type:complete len:88 (+) Transcript_16513:202-465(+)
MRWNTCLVALGRPCFAGGALPPVTRRSDGVRAALCCCRRCATVWPPHTRQTRKLPHPSYKQNARNSTELAAQPGNESTKGVLPPPAK